MFQDCFAFFYEAMDVNSDGRLSYFEFLRACKHMQMRNARAVWSALGRSGFLAEVVFMASACGNLGKVQDVESREDKASAAKRIQPQKCGSSSRDTPDPKHYPKLSHATGKHLDGCQALSLKILKTRFRQLARSGPLAGAAAGRSRCQALVPWPSLG